MRRQFSAISSYVTKMKLYLLKRSVHCRRCHCYSCNYCLRSAGLERESSGYYWMRTFSDGCGVSLKRNRIVSNMAAACRSWRWRSPTFSHSSYSSSATLLLWSASCFKTISCCKVLSARWVFHVVMDTLWRRKEAYFRKGPKSSSFKRISVPIPFFTFYKSSNFNIP